jgi:DNA polymerase-3 subunit gamma/tau
VAINEGRFVDLLEVDAASRTKVEDTREILDNVQYAPSQGRYKVYLIDEVHMLSSSSFNALLKTLEEPPAHVKFLLATTDPQKLPATILSRCLQFNLKNLTAERIVDYLKTILEKEMVQYEEPSLWLLGRRQYARCLKFDRPGHRVWVGKTGGGRCAPNAGDDRPRLGLSPY